jgi:hypothetical protein
MATTVKMATMVAEVSKETMVTDKHDNLINHNEGNEITQGNRGD